MTRREARRLSDDEVRTLCKFATPRYQPVITTLAWTGLRVSEALALRWEDIDFDGREIRVRFQLDERYKPKRPKTRPGTRSVPLLPILDEALRAHRRQQGPRGPLCLSRNENPRASGGFRGGRYWARTSDPQLVELVLSQLS